MSAKLARRFVFLTKRLEELDKERYRHLDEIQKIIREHKDASKEIAEIKPAVLAWNEQELVRLGVRLPNPSDQRAGASPAPSESRC